MKDDRPWFLRPVYLDDSRLTPPEKRDRIYVLQDGKCGACGVAGLTRAVPGGRAKLFLDHDHYSGLARGMICQPCNQREGIMNTSPSCPGYPHIAAYLASPPAAPLDLMWDFPAGWTCADLRRLRKIGGISVLEYVRSHGLLVVSRLAA